MNTQFFVAYILILTIGFTSFYAEVREFYTPVKMYQNKISSLELKIKKERFEHLLTSYEFIDFRTHVATLLPEKIKEKGPGEKSYQLRNLASVVQKSENDNISIIRGHRLFEDGKKFFRQKKYSEAVKAFSVLITRHSYSAHVPEALFLLAEASYVLRDYEDCNLYVNKLIDLFPDNELTGYAMIRLGKVFEEQQRFDNAIEIYQTVIKSFPKRNVASVANQSLKEVEL